MREAKREAIYKFSQTSLKHPMSRYFLQCLLEKPELLDRITFVQSAEFLPNTLFVAQDGCAGRPFQLELGAHVREEVSIVNGRLVKHKRRSSGLHVEEPIEALGPLKESRSRIYTIFLFDGPAPDWYRAVEEPNPALAPDDEARRQLERTLLQIVREQIDLVLWGILLKAAIDDALSRRDREEFHRLARLYNEVRARALWEL